MEHDGTILHTVTVRLPVLPTPEETQRIYDAELDRRGLKAVGDVVTYVQPEFFSSEVEVTYRARLGEKETV